MLDITYETFASNTEKLELLIQDFDSNQKEIKNILENIPKYWVSPESEEYYNRYRRVKDNPAGLKELVFEVSTRMRELYDSLKVVVDAKLRGG